MRTRRFHADSVAEAYDQVRDALGDDAIIVSTRHAVAPGFLGIGKHEVVEVIAGLADDTVTAAPAAAAPRAGRGLDVSLPQERPGVLPVSPVRLPTGPLAPAPVAPPLPHVPGDAMLAPQADDVEDDLAPPFLNSLAGIGRGGPFDVHERSEARVPRTPVETFEAPRLVEPAPQVDRDALVQLTTGLEEVRALVQQLALERLSARVEDGPAILAPLREQLAAQGVAPAVALPLLAHIALALQPNASAEAARQAVERKLAADLPAPAVVDLTKRPSAVFLVGPSGAGKTTAAVRLGMQYALQGLRVTIAGTDVDRAGAPQQLQAFAAASGLRTRMCYTPGELQALLAGADVDVVIVDAPGHNGTRTDRMAELNAFSQVARDRNVLLTLPATMQREDLLRVTRAYASLRPKGLVLTRCDETETFGGLLTAVAQSGLGVAYTTHDEAVSDAARLGDNRALVSAVLAGRWPARTTNNALTRERRAG